MFCTIKRLALAGALALTALALVPFSGAFARGPGNYAIAGVEGSGGSYTGTSSLTQTGQNTWRIVWRIGNQVWNGYGIGDGKIIALNFSGHGQTGVMLLIDKEDGTGYNAAWAYSGARTVGTENWVRQ